MWWGYIDSVGIREICAKGTIVTLGADSRIEKVSGDSMVSVYVADSDNDKVKEILTNGNIVHWATDSFIQVVLLLISQQRVRCGHLE